MADIGSIGKAKIKKKSYTFDVRKRYQSSLRFAIKERPPIERIKDAMKLLISPKKEAKAAQSAKTAAPAPGGFNFFVFGAAILIALIIMFIGYLYLTTQVLAQTASAPQVEKPSIENTVATSDLLTAGERGSAEQVAALGIDYNTQNLNNYTISIATYNGKIPSQVFVLESDKIEASTYPDFITQLRANLIRRKIILNPVTIRQLETMPDGAIVLVPSGVAPEELLGVGSTISMDKLADRGIVVIYIGQPFTKMLNNTLVIPTPASVVSSLPVVFDERSPPQSTGDFQLFEPLYRASPRGGWGSGSIYGSISLLKKNDGAFLFIPQTLDGGWRGNATAAASDISTIIFDTPWADSTGVQPSVYLMANSTNYSGASYFFSNPFKGDIVTMKVDFTGYSSASNYPIEETLYSHTTKSTLGDLYIVGGNTVVPFNLTSTRTRINAKLNEPSSSQPNMYLSIIDSNGTEMQNIPEGNVNVQAEASFDLPVYVDRGEYIVRLIDDNGKVYAQTYMKVVSIDISFNGLNNQKHSVYGFDISMGGNPVTLNKVTVVVDGGKSGTYQFTGTSHLAVDVGQYSSGDFLGYGDHTFEFSSGDLKETYLYNRPIPQSLFTNPIFWVVGFLTLGIVGIGIVFARQESVFFFIDIPDFPPVARTRIPLPSSTVLSILEKVNENYRWKNTPLTAPEIKNGFKDVFYKGKPIYLTDYNVEYLLDELHSKRLVDESGGYYGLADWENRTGRSISYLALMRHLRDICVNNAVPFTQLGESKLCDSEITVVGQQMYLHFFGKGQSNQQLLVNILNTIQKGITIVLFETDQEKSEFQSLLHSPSAAPIILKMEADSGSVMMLTVPDFEKMLMEFKSM